MSKKYLGVHDFTNASEVVPVYAGDPNGAVSGVAGQILWNSSTGFFHGCVGTTTWKKFNLGDVTGPASSTDKEIVRFNSTTGKLVQASATPVTISDAGSINIPTGEAYKINGTALAKGDIGLGSVTNDAQVKASVGTAKGSLIGFSASATPAELTVGTNGQALLAASGQTTGLLWTTLTSSSVGLGNVTNDAQVKKTATVTSGNVPTWNGTSGDALNDGYGVETTLTGSSSNLARADAIKTYVDNASAQSKFFRPAVVVAFNDAGNSLPLVTSTQIDGHTIVDTDRVVVFDSATAGEKYKIYAATVVTTVISWTVQQDGSGADLPKDGATVWVQLGTTYADEAWTYNGTIWVQTSGSGSIPDATTSVKGKVQLASTVEAKTRTDTGKAVVPSGLADFFVTDDSTVTTLSVIVEDGTTGRKAKASLVTIDANGTINIPTGQTYKINGTALAKGDVGLGNVTNDAQVKASVGTAKGSLIGFSASATPSELTVGTNNQILMAASGQTTGLIWHSLTASDVSLGNVTNDAQVKKSEYTAKGDVLVGTGAGTYVALGVGTNGKVLTAASGETSGLIWATPSSGAYECTVGATGADYTTLGAAVTAGKKRFLLIDNTTETGAVVLAANSLLSSVGYNKSVDMGASSLTVGTDSVIDTVKIKGSVALVSSANGVTYRNCRINNGIAVSANEIFIQFCKVGADAGSGSATIDVASGATDTIISGCRVDAAITDAGTGTVADYVLY